MKLINFQKEDIARLALHDGGILAWEPGMGKTLAMFLWPLLKLGWTGHLLPKEPVLLVASQDLHGQIISEAQKHFGIVPIVLKSQGHFLRISKLTTDGRRTLSPAFYLTSYCDLTQNGVEPFPEVEWQVYSMNLGESRYYPKLKRSVRCVYSPTLADLCQDSFGAIVCDEGVKLKGNDSLIGLGVRQMNAHYRLVLTGTPIKNRIGDVFHLAHFVTGCTHDPHPRFPYAADQQGDFVKRFSVQERNLTAEETTGRRTFKPVPQICSVPLLQKLLAPVILRRRKDECGEQLVPMNVRTVAVPFGKAQASTYKTILGKSYRDKNGKPAIGAKLQDLRAAS
jgi:SNF2 family DNA or RNA helicase